MGRAVWLADVLTDAGLVVKPFAGWETRGGNDFAPEGVVLHHTVTKPSTADTTVDKTLALTGSSSVPAPLCNYSTNRNGTVSIIAAGTANHAGVGVWKGRSGNRFFFGDEMKNLGQVEPWAPAQLESARIAAAAVLTHLETTSAWLCGHKEYATPAGRKTDPHTLNMNSERLLVARLIGDGMAVLTEAEQRELQTFLAHIAASNSNVGFVTQCIEDIREKNAAGGYVPKGTAIIDEEAVKAIINGSQIVAP